MVSDREFREASQSLPCFILNELEKVPKHIREIAQEIRIRSGRNIEINYQNNRYFLKNTISQSMVNECYKSICGYSIHSKTHQIKQGFITIRGGHRAGICGTAVYEDDNLIGITNINAINIRIARQIKGVADDLIEKLNGSVGNTLIVGSPGSGKTTLLKDIIRNLKIKKVSVIDTRGELAAISSGSPQNDVGNADVFDGYKRSEGINIAVRTMSPDIIICDELGDMEDVRALNGCVGAGVAIIATVHCLDEKELKSREIIRQILKTGAFKNIVILEGAKRPSYIKSIKEVKRVYEDDRSDTYKHMSDNDSVLLFKKTQYN